VAPSASFVSYAVISPVKNEEHYIRETITSMISQTVRPVVWIIVDDASTDDTARIVKECESSYPWVRYLLHPGQAVRNTGSAEVHAFDYGLKTLVDTNYDFIVKLDGDLRFGEAYFETILANLKDNPRLGIASGIYLEETANSWHPVTMPHYHAAGASKVVRRECFEQIGGFIAERGWDTIDEIRAQARGWETRHFNDIQFYHLRKEGTGMGHIHTNVMHGEIFYRTGGDFIFFTAKALHRLIRGNPFIVAGVAMMYGYLSAFIRKRKPLVSAIEARTYRRLLYRRLYGRLRSLVPFHF
jgi:biofilm PGA synthesis N-glycosyltransferase PgaC